jgi:hypothetical protein
MDKAANIFRKLKRLVGYETAAAQTLEHKVLPNLGKALQRPRPRTPATQKAIRMRRAMINRLDRMAY